jgi:predicted ATPase/DNA-binding CsgD family transcriptional regulator
VEGSAAATGAGGLHGFPVTLTSFVGRADAVSEVAGLLAECRLVTVTGPGGSGKTRLAAEVAGQVAGDFADGVWLVELAAVQDPAQIPAALAAALGVRGQREVPAADAVTRALSRQQSLLVLDNCEHVIGAAAGLCGELLAAADDVRVLATSREPLRVAGEVRYRLAPLELPQPGDGAAGGGCEAMTLFADRARRADPRFALDAETGPAAAELVTRLDGMPLAIELAAARVEALGVAKLLERIDDRLALLTTGDRLAADRQRSLAATVEWSYQLLADPEKKVFRQLSVFPAGFTLEAAEAVAGPGTGPAVLALVDCSLLSPPRPGPDGRARYLMLETLRAYGASQAAAGERADAAASLAAYTVRVAEEASAGLETTTRELSAAQWLDAEDATMREVLAWAMDHDPAVALRLAAALAPWWHLRGRGTGNAALLREAAARAGPGSEAWCTAQLWLGQASLNSGDVVESLGHVTAIRDALTGRPPSRVLADCLAVRSVALSVLGREAEAAEDAARSLALARELRYPAGEVKALINLMIVAYDSGDLEEALRRGRESERIAADVSGWFTRTRVYVLAFVLTATGDLAAAEHNCAMGLASCRDIGDPERQAGLLIQLAVVDTQAGRAGEAAAHLAEGLQIGVRIGGGFEVLNGLDCCGHLCAATGRPADAITAWAALAALREQQAVPDVAVEARRRQEPEHKARQVLGPARARAAEKRGAAMSLATAAEYVLMLTAPGPPAAAHGGHDAAKLSARERELVTLVAQGATNAQIAAQLYISVRTVSSHLERIRDKTGCRRRADLTRLALTAGLV